MSERLERVPPVDVLTRDGVTLALYPGRLLRLSDLGAAVLEATTVPRTLQELAAILAAEFGTPDGLDPVAATDAITQTLLAEGLLRALEVDA